MKITIDVDDALHARLRDAAEGGELSVEDVTIVLVARGIRDAYGDPLWGENNALRTLIANARADLLEHAEDGDCAGPHGAAGRGACSACSIAEELGRAAKPHAVVLTRDQVRALLAEGREGRYAIEARRASLAIDGPKGKP